MKGHLYARQRDNIRVVNLLEDILESTIVFFHDGILGRQELDIHMSSMMSEDV